jgi:aspartate kinase
LRVVNFSSGLLSEGTQITGVFNSNIFEINEKKGIMSVSLVCNIEPENVSKILTLFRNRAIYGISTGRVSLTVFTSSEEPSMLINELHNSGLCKALSHRCNIGLIELTHPVFVESPGWIASISNALSEDNINIIEITTSKSTINIFIDELKIKDALKAMRYKLES